MASCYTCIGKRTALFALLWYFLFVGQNCMNVGVLMFVRDGPSPFSEPLLWSLLFAYGPVHSLTHFISILYRRLIVPRAKNGRDLQGTVCICYVLHVVRREEWMGSISWLGDLSRRTHWLQSTYVHSLPFVCIPIYWGGCFTGVDDTSPTRVSDKRAN